MRLESEKEQDCSLVEKLGEYPTSGPKLEQLVSYPPKLEVIPVKPLFFDVAWNYIEYPEREQVLDSHDNVSKSQKLAGAGQQKKGWFTFGR